MKRRLTYLDPIRIFGSSKEIAVISMLSENTQYEMTKPLKLKLVDGSEKEVLSKTYKSRELNAFVEGKHIVSYLDNDLQIIKTNKLAKVTNMSLKLDELDNSGNLKDGHPSNTLFMYYMPGSEDFMCFKPMTPRYKKLKYGEIVSLTLKITDQNNNIFTILKMYITINIIKAEKRIDLSYSIQNFDSSKEITVIRMLSDNVKYKILKLRAVMDPISNTKKMIPSGTCTGRELISIVEGMVELNKFVVDDQVIKMNKLKSITEMINDLDELNSSDSLEDGHPSNTLFT